MAEVPGAGGRWKQVHFNVDVMRRFFHLGQNNALSVTLERLDSTGVVAARTSRQLVFSDANSNSKLEFDFGSAAYPSGDSKPILVAVEASYLTFRYRLVMPTDPGYQQLGSLLSAGPSVGRGVRRRLVTLDDVESYWPQVNLRGE
ncbi:hypothetical protein LG314_12670 [Agrococcus terreus]|uniref:hypothetical protein n=1 Tax=Agrococcus terreus TaxID=574649 RepID=UPI00384DD492